MNMKYTEDLSYETV